MSVVVENRKKLIEEVLSNPESPYYIYFTTPGNASGGVEEGTGLGTVNITVSGEDDITLDIETDAVLTTSGSDIDFTKRLKPTVFKALPNGTYFEYFVDGQGHDHQINFYLIEDASGTKLFNFVIIQIPEEGLDETEGAASTKSHTVGGGGGRN